MVGGGGGVWGDIGMNDMISTLLMYQGDKW